MCLFFVEIKNNSYLCRLNVYWGSLLNIVRYWAYLQVFSDVLF